ncbi:MAG: flagellar motor protein MotB [Methylococcaceae bacterium]|nr:flagellar motor protein MotB [Methylococcaceae bacterium]
MADNQAIIIKKVKKGGHGSHGGAWKLAYADFVTAMMAFFLLMWLLGSTTKEQRKGIADYFKDPWQPAASISGGESTGDRSNIIKGGGQDVTATEGQVKLTNEGKKEIIADTAEKDNQQVLDQDKQNLESLKQKLDEMIKTDELLHQFESQLKIDITREGLRIQIIDQEKRPMFAAGSARMESYAAQILDQLAPTINALPNRLSISGHTDAKPLGNSLGYTNWELSTDRANAARKELVRGGLKQEKMMRVVGLADSVPMMQSDPFDPINRRISIVILNKKTEEDLLSGSQINVTGDDVKNAGEGKGGSWLAPKVPGMIAAPPPPASAPSNP